MWDVAIFGGVENAEMENVGPLDFDYCCMRYTCIQFTSVLCCLFGIFIAAFSLQFNVSFVSAE